MFIIKTDIMGPAAAIATKPKLSTSEALLSFLEEEIPIAKAKIKGTTKAL